jgi:hypothetical protein
MQIETKYNIWDTVWTLYWYKIQKWKIKKIYIVVKNENPYIEYEVNFGWIAQTRAEEEFIMKTKEELLELL